MNNILGMVLKQVYSVGISTANAISRACIYEPEEDIILFEMISDKQDNTDTE